MHCNVYQSLFLFSDALYHFCALFAVKLRGSGGCQCSYLMHQTGISVGSGCFERSIAHVEVYCTTIIISRPVQGLV